MGNGSMCNSIQNSSCQVNNQVNNDYENRFLNDLYENNFNNKNKNNLISNSASCNLNNNLCLKNCDNNVTLNLTNQKDYKLSNLKFNDKINKSKKKVVNNDYFMLNGHLQKYYNYDSNDISTINNNKPLNLLQSKIAKVMTTNNVNNSSIMDNSNIEKEKNSSCEVCEVDVNKKFTFGADNKNITNFSIRKKEAYNLDNENKADKIIFTTRISLKPKFVSTCIE